jgi:hypothetical protein
MQPHLTSGPLFIYSFRLNKRRVTVARFCATVKSDQSAWTLYKSTRCRHRLRHRFALVRPRRCYVEGRLRHSCGPPEPPTCRNETRLPLRDPPFDPKARHAEAGGARSRAISDTISANIPRATATSPNHDGTRLRFARDSALERSGFEPSVPRKTHYGSTLFSCPFCHGSRSAKGTHPFRDRDRFRPFTQTGGAP